MGLAPEDELARLLLNDQLLHQQRLEAAGTLAAGLAHDMNNVLASIMCIADAMLDESSDPRLRADLEHIVQQAERGSDLTRSLLAFSRKGQYRKQVLQVDQALHSALPLLAHTLPKSIAVHTELGAGDARIEADPAQLVQVLVNLSINAAHAMNGEGTLSVRSGVAELDREAAARHGLPPGRHVCLRVADTGCGMDEATRKRAFEPFFTTKADGQGTGLGLSLVWGVIRGHGGAVAVDSRVGAGTAFTIYLPITEATLSVRAHERVPRETACQTVLVVDDEPVVRAGMTRILERLGYTVLGAANGAEALRVFGVHGARIALVILDIGMPVMGGAECFQRFRELTSVPILIATGYALETEVQQLVARGAALIEKPFASSALIVEVARLLDQSGGR